MTNVSIKKILILALILRVIAACISHRYYHADEHFQVLEPAYGAVHGFWMKTWEWERGLRSWVFPGLLIPPLALLKVFGIENPWVVGAFVRTLMGAFSLIGIYFAYRLARIYLNELQSKAFAFFIAVTPAFIFFGVRTQPESVCSTLGLVALVWILESRKSKILFYAGLLSGLSYMVRFQSGVFTLGLGLILLSQKRIKEFSIFSAGVLFVLTLQGWVDSLTWGNWFHSSIEYVRFNLIEGGAAAWFGEKPWHKLFLGVGRIFGFTNIPILYGYMIYAVVKKRKLVLPLLITVVLFQGFHHFLSHKEDRFLIPILPEILCAAFIGFVAHYQATRLKVGFKFVHVLAVVFFLGWLGRAVTWSWGFKDPTLVRTYRIGQDMKTRGVVLLGSGEHETGGYFYLGRNIPFQVARAPSEINKEEFGKTINRFILGNSLDYPQPNVLKELGLYVEGMTCEKLTEMGMNTWSCERAN